MKSGEDDLRTKKRSAFRLACGGYYYSAKRYLHWIFKDYRFAKTKVNKNFSYEYLTHKTPLLRPLKDVEMKYQIQKVNNLKIAITHLDHIVIQPKETFSYWKLIGKPSYKKGYQDGMILQDGKVVYGVGGGLCQLSNLLFWITVHTPLEIVERHRHGYDVFPDANRTQPFGSGATCFYPYGDLMIYNPTNYPLQLQLKITSKNLQGAWYSEHPVSEKYVIEERNHEIKSEWWGGYSRHNELYKMTYSLDGILLDERKLVENHAMMMYEPLLSQKNSFEL